tara:strand:+ start:1384 stop:2220 length:837 start_codon:yes stop_codon:yes gene_type:complete
MKSLNKKNVLITGGAQGIGKGLARACLKEGARVTITNLNKEIADRTISELSSLGKIQSINCDATDPAAVNAMLNQIWHAEGPIDIVFCNAGAGAMRPILETTASDIREQFAVNYDACIYLAQSYVDRMIKEKKAGHIMFTGSEHSLVLPEGSESLAMSIYGGTKHALLIFAEWLKHELKETQISVSMLLPGPVKTERLSDTFSMLEENPDNEDLRQRFSLEAETALRDRFISPEQCAEIALKGLKKNLFFIPAQKHIRVDVLKRNEEIMQAFSALGLD